MSLEVSTAAQIDRLTTAAFELTCERGFAELSARTLAAYTGGSPSAINYHFGGRDQLLLAVYAEATRRMEASRAAALARCLEAAPAWAELPDVFVALLQMRLSEQRKALILLQELEYEVTAGREPHLEPAARQEIERELQFWRELAVRFGTASASAGAWSDLALGLTGLLLCETDPAARSAWISAPAARLHQRLGRLPIALSVTRKANARASIDSVAQDRPPGNETAQRILDAALSTIAKKGADRLVQREIAAQVGVSLAAVTYFFRTKHDLITAAFAELCRRMHGNTILFESLPPSDAIGVFTQEESLSSTAALAALLRAAARDESLAPIAREIRQIRGIGSIVMLQKHGVASDWLDAYLLGVMTASAYRQCQVLAPAALEATITASTAETLKSVFVQA